MTRARNVADIIKQPFTTTLGTSNYRAGVNAGDAIASGTNFNTLIGDEAGTTLNSGDNNVFVGFSAGELTTSGAENVLVGSEAGEANITGANNVAVGFQAFTADTKGFSGVAVGAFALTSQNFTSNTDSFNVAVGINAGKFATTAQNSTFIGADAAKGITGTKLTGNNNTAIGKDAGLLLQGAATNNTIVGEGAGAAITTGVENIIVGGEAGDAIQTGGQNTLVGYNAGGATTGSLNAFYGRSSGSAITDGTKNSIIGSYNGNQGGLDLRSANNCIVLSDGDGNVKHFMNEAKNHGFASIDFNTANGNVGNIFAYEAASNNLVNFYHLNTAAIFNIFETRRNGRTQERLAQINMGENASNQGEVTIFSSAANADVSGGVVLANAATSFSSASDIRLKTVTGTYDNALQDIAKIEPIKFTWKNDSTNKANVGVSAQSVQKVVPEAVDARANTLTPDDETEYLNVKYTELIPLMIASIQELSAKNDALEARIATLEG